jgi:DNA-directed RNA polymerase specialized sigma24 family protein
MRAGRPGAREILADSARSVALRVAQRRFRLRREDAEDVAQEVAMLVSQHAEDLPVTPAWIMNGVRFRCVDYARKRAVETRMLAEYADELRDRVSGGDSDLVHRDVQLRRAIESLDSPCRALVWMYFYEQKTWAEIDAELSGGNRCAQYRTKCCLQRLLALVRGAG